MTDWVNTGLTVSLAAAPGSLWIIVAGYSECISGSSTAAGKDHMEDSASGNVRLDQEVNRCNHIVYHMHPFEALSSFPYANAGPRCTPSPGHSPEPMMHRGSRLHHGNCGVWRVVFGHISISLQPCLWNVRVIVFLWPPRTWLLKPYLVQGVLLCIWLHSVLSGDASLLLPVGCLI